MHACGCYLPILKIVSNSCGPFCNATTITVTLTDPVKRLGRWGAASMNIAQVGSSLGGCLLVPGFLQRSLITAHSSMFLSISFSFSSSSSFPLRYSLNDCFREISSHAHTIFFFTGQKVFTVTHVLSGGSADFFIGDVVGV